MIQFDYIWLLVVFALIVLVYFQKECFFKKTDTKRELFFKKKDTSITDKLIDKYPDVSPDFYSKSWREQSAENNQEIHDQNKRLEKIEEKQEKILYYLDNLNKKQGMILDEIKKNN